MNIRAPAQRLSMNTDITMTTTYRHWIFDMDGTLTMAAHDFDAIRKELNIESGIPILEAIETMPPQLAQQTSAKLHQLELEIAAESVAQPDAEAMLEHLQTRNAEDIATVTLQAAGLAKYFQGTCVIGRERCLPKPDPAGLHHLLGNWQADTQHAVMVGDYVFDLQAGRNAGVATVHFSPASEFHWPELSDHCVTTLAALTELSH
jgi:HAD superfamily hydrolase (TIGR01509 family)